MYGYAVVIGSQEVVVPRIVSGGINPASVAIAEVMENGSRMHGLGDDPKRFVVLRGPINSNGEARAVRRAINS
jgi:hypothetical protein